MNVKHYLRILCEYSLMVIYRCAVWKVRQSIMIAWLRYADKVERTYRHSFCSQGISRILPPATADILDILEHHRDFIISIAAEYIAHRFDVLGSGWIQVRHGMECQGLNNYQYHTSSKQAAGAVHSSSLTNKSNQQEAERIASLLDKTYVPIDWHLDF